MSHAATIAGGLLPSTLESSHVSTRPAASLTTNDFHAIENPLWVIVIGMACFFGLAALIIACS
jgi:hypothetical protein